MIAYLIARAREASTWRGLILIITSLGIVISPDQAAAITSAGMGLAGLAGVALPDLAK